MSRGPRLAVFVSPHGFGHAARASALMGSVHGLVGARFDLFTEVPRWFFDESVEGLYDYHPLLTDVGLRQRSALEFDGPATVAALDDLLPFDEATVSGLARHLNERGCRGVICDISPLGVAVAQRAGLASVLVENFTWPWLYGPMFEGLPGLRSHAETIAEWLSRATYHVQTEPLCERTPGAHLRANPMSRPARRPRAAVRESLRIGPDAALVVVTMGGVPEPVPPLELLHGMEGVTFLITGAPATRASRNVLLYDNRTRLYMPDLVRASDAVVAKAGYSTVAEVWAQGRPLAFVTRPDFRETGPLREWITSEIPGFEIPGVDFASGGWACRIPELLELRGRSHHEENGAAQVGRFLVEALDLRPES